MLKRVIVFNNIANLKENSNSQYEDYFNFIEPSFKKTFYTMFNQADIPVSDQGIEKRLEYCFGEAPKILDSLIASGIHEKLNVPATLNLESGTSQETALAEIRTFVETIISLYLVNYEKDGRFASEDFQEKFFGYIKELYNKRDYAEIVPEEYKFLFHFLIRKLLWYHTTISKKRDSEYLNGTVNELLNFVMDNSEWYNYYEGKASTNITGTTTQPEIHEVEESTSKE